MTLFLHGVKLLILVLVSGTIASTNTSEYNDHNRVFRIIKTGILEIRAHNSTVHLIIATGSTLMRNTLLTKRADTSKPLTLDGNCGINRVCAKSENVTHVIIETNPDSEVISISRTVADPDAALIDCYDLTDHAQWSGGPQLRHQNWPIQNMYYEEEPYLPTHQKNMALSERYWLSSDGVYVYVNERDPLFLDQNNYKNGYLCLIAKNKAPYRRRETVTLNYEIGAFINPRTAHEHVIKTHLGKPNGHPNERMVKHPVWSTWARYKMNVNEHVVESFADEILAHKFNNSQLEIDDNWETCYGSAEFDKKKFPNITRLTNKLKEKGFRTTLWVHPFINEGCEPAYSTALNNNYFVKNLEGKVHMSWWQGANAATIDFTNPKAVEWWVARLKRIEQQGIDSFKFDAGEVSWLPQVASLNGPLDMQPGIFTQDYVNALVKNFDDNIEVRVGWRTQDLPVFVRMIDKDTRWTWNNGIPTLITTLLQMNLNGYVYVLPDMIGGNGYLNNSFNGTENPSKELFIRWLQANVFMPSLQYSFVPWDYDFQTVEICKKYTDLHAELTPTIMNLMKKAVLTGAPINPPIWWVDPTNVQAHKINDEYLLGEDILVAPVIEEDAVTRDVYLPSGAWLDPKSNKTFIGPMWLNNYKAPLDTLLYFTRTSVTSEDA